MARTCYARYISQESFNLRNLRSMEDVEAVGFRSGNPWIGSYVGDRINLITGEVENDAETRELDREAENRDQAAHGQAILPLEPLTDEPGEPPSAQG